MRRGIVIPACPLMLDENREFDRRRQKALVQYYLEAGVGGLAVGVHTTQFEIRDVGLYQPVLALAAQQIARFGKKDFVAVAGLAGKTEAARAEAVVARELGYHAGLLSLAAWGGASHDEIITHCRAVAEQIPIIGFYLQPAVGGIELDAEFWRRFALIENVVAIKVACFDRYKTLDVLHGVVAARAEDRITLYTGNDDHIVADLVTPFVIHRDNQPVIARFKGGLLGHWSVWAQKAVGLLQQCHDAVGAGSVPADLLALDSQVTDANAAFFDVANNFAGCISGCHEILRRQGFVDGIWLLDRNENLSPGQGALIDRVCADYPHLNDDAFVAANLSRWLQA
ncbi:MAG: dihydrodipicolinate synthase family protein [Alphaproteobacteria bacterium]|nr:dihydrodipicolinate synthase family protein [Alphaproteobacteria bacterium]